MHPSDVVLISAAHKNMCRAGVSHPPGRQTPIARACFTPHTHCTLQGQTHGGSQFQVRPSSNAFSAFHSAGENTLADDLFKVCALFFYASYVSQVMHMLHHRHSTHTPGHRCFAAYLRHRLINTFPSKSCTCTHTSPWLAIGIRRVE